MSKKFTLVTFRVQDGEREYYNYYSFHTSDYQKMTPMQAIAHFFEGDKNYKLDRLYQVFLCGCFRIGDLRQRTG